jgi:N-acyl-L-homoserine lactone synthetase
MTPKHTLIMSCGIHQALLRGHQRRTRYRDPYNADKTVRHVGYTTTHDPEGDVRILKTTSTGLLNKQITPLLIRNKAPL